MRYLIFLLIYLCAYARPPVNVYLSPYGNISLINPAMPSNPFLYQRAPGNYLELVNNPFQIYNTMPTYVDVRKVNQFGVYHDNISYQTKLTELFKNSSMTLPTGANVYDPYTQKATPVATGLNFMVYNKVNEDDRDKLNVYFVNNKGEIVKSDGSHYTDHFYLYQLDYSAFDIYRTLDQINNVNRLVDEAGTVEYEEDREDCFMFTDTPPLSTQDSQVDTSTNKTSTYEYMLSKRDDFLKNGKSSCYKKLKDFETKDTDPNRPKRLWPLNLTEKQRARKVYEEAKNSYRKVLSSKYKNQSHKISKNNVVSKTDMSDPTVIHPLATPELMACIAYQENRGRLDPQRFNYTYCYNTPNLKSTAFGFSQVLKKTLRDYIDVHFTNQIPITSGTTVNGKQMKEESTATEILHAQSDSVELQFEVMFRILNRKLKVRATSGKEKTLYRGVASYDTDDKENYLDNVIENCLPCMNTSKGKEDPYECYEKMAK